MRQIYDIKYLFLLICSSIVNAQHTDPDIWSKKSSPALDKDRLAMFNKILHIYYSYFKNGDQLHEYPDNKLFFKKIKSNCDLIEEVTHYVKHANHYEPHYEYVVYNGRAVRKRKCYSKMKKLYEWLLAFDPQDVSNESSADGSEANIEHEEASI